MLGVIGGSGLYSLAGFPELPGEVPQPTLNRWGEISSPVAVGGERDARVAFIARHGRAHTIPPHRVNYRANIEALRLAGIDRILAVGSVGGIDPACRPGALVVPDQLIDYTSGREASFALPSDPVRHVDFTEPFSPDWRGRVITALREITPGDDVPLIEAGTYGVASGPRFETAAEIARMKRDGCTIVGMTAMPEAVLAREAGIRYAMVCPVGNLAAGVGSGELDQRQVFAAAAAATEPVRRLISVLA